MDENWLPVVGYESLYEVSSLGRVRSLDRTSHSIAGWSQLKKGRILVQSPDSDGYLLVNLHKSKTSKSAKVHALVAAAFIGHRPAGFDVAHNDGSRSHNAVSNLRYATKRENQADRKLHGTTCSGQRNGCAKLTADDVAAIRTSVDTQSSIAKRFGISQTNVSMIKLGKTWAAQHGVTSAHEEQ